MLCHNNMTMKEISKTGIIPCSREDRNNIHLLIFILQRFFLVTATWGFWNMLHLGANTNTNINYFRRQMAHRWLLEIVTSSPPEGQNENTVYSCDSRKLYSIQPSEQWIGDHKATTLCGGGVRVITWTWKLFLLKTKLFTWVHKLSKIRIKVWHLYLYFASVSFTLGHLLIYVHRYTNRSWTPI